MADQVLIENRQKRSWTIPAAAAVGALNDVTIPAGEAAVVDSAHWKHVCDDGKNKVVQALLDGRHLVVSDPSKAGGRRDRYELVNPDSPTTPQQLQETPVDGEKVKQTARTRSTRAPVVGK